MNKLCKSRNWLIHKLYGRLKRVTECPCNVWVSKGKEYNQTKARNTGDSWRMATQNRYSWIMNERNSNTAVDYFHFNRGLVGRITWILLLTEYISVWTVNDIPLLKMKSDQAMDLLPFISVCFCHNVNIRNIHLAKQEKQNNLYSAKVQWDFFWAARLLGIHGIISANTRS